MFFADNNEPVALAGAKNLGCQTAGIDAPEISIHYGPVLCYQKPR